MLDNVEKSGGLGEQTCATLLDNCCLNVLDPNLCFVFSLHGIMSHMVADFLLPGQHNSTVDVRNELFDLHCSNEKQESDKYMIGVEMMMICSLKQYKTDT